MITVYVLVLSVCQYKYGCTALVEEFDLLEECRSRQALYSAEYAKGSLTSVKVLGCFPKSRISRA